MVIGVLIEKVPGSKDLQALHRGPGLEREAHHPVGLPHDGDVAGEGRGDRPRRRCPCTRSPPASPRRLRGRRRGPAMPRSLQERDQGCDAPRHEDLDGSIPVASAPMRRWRSLRGVRRQCTKTNRVCCKGALGCPRWGPAAVPEGCIFTGRAPPLPRHAPPGGRRGPGRPPRAASSSPRSGPGSGRPARGTPSASARVRLATERTEPLPPEQRVGEGRDVGHVDPSAHHRPSAVDGAQRRGDQLAGGREEDGGVEWPGGSSADVPTQEAPSGGPGRPAGRSRSA